MHRTLFFWLSLAAFFLAGCERKQQPVEDISPAPALWSIEKDGHKGWLFGTVHLLPDGQEWESPAVANAINGSELLVLEATGLDNERRTSRIFEGLAKSPDLPPLPERLPSSRRAALMALMDRLNVSEGSLAAYESWGAALLLSSGIQQDLDLRAGDGIDRQLSQTFLERGKTVAGLETVEEQLGIFDALPEAAQRDFLLQVVDEADTAGGRYRELLEAWLRGDVDRIGREFITEFGKTPQLVGPLLIERNRSWSRQVGALMQQPGTIFVAVGAGHLAGPQSLQSMLASQGFRITRVQ
jgi:uncharacterized protein